MAATALVLLISSCTGSTSPEPPPPAPAASSKQASPSPTSDRDRVEANARKALDDYYQVLDDIATNPDAPLARLDESLSGDYLTAWRTNLEKSRTDGWTQTGSTELIEVVTQGVEASPGSSNASVVFDICYDVSATDVVDASGKSVIPANRPDRGWERLTVTNEYFAEEPEAGWRVSDGETLEEEPCTDS